MRKPVFTEIDRKYYLSDRRGKVLYDESWSSHPTIYQVFVISEDSKRLYTLLGKCIDIDADAIEMVFKFWVVYRKNGVQYICALEPFGSGYECSEPLMATKIGLLDYEGCVVSNSYNNWEIYKYDSGLLYLDETVPVNSVSPCQALELCGKGFTPEYLSYLSGNKYDYSNLDYKKLWLNTNDSFLRIIDKIYELSEEYTLEDIADLLGLKSNIVSAIKQISNKVSISE